MPGKLTALLVGLLALGFACGKGGDSTDTTSTASSSGTTTSPTSPTTPATPNLSGSVFSFDFRNGVQGWTGDITGYFPDNEQLVRKAVDYRALPDPLDQSTSALYITGGRPGVILFFKRQLPGLSPNAQYSATFSIEIATPYSGSCPGAGGLPARTAVYVGGSAAEPVKTLESGAYSLSLAPLGSSGAAGGTLSIGTVENSRPECDWIWELKSLSSASDGLRVHTDAQGTVWLFVGFRSAWDGYTELYLTKAAVGLQTVK